MRASVLSWYTAGSLPPYPSSTIKSPITSYIPILSIPLPPASFFTPSLSAALASTSVPVPLLEAVPLVLAIQQYTLGSLFRVSLSAEESKLRISGLASCVASGAGPLEWRGLLDSAPATDVDEGVRKRVDGMMASMFGTLTKGCVGADSFASADDLLLLRSQALRWFATSRALRDDPAKLASFWDQLRKVLLQYGRQAEAGGVSEVRIGERVKGVFEEVLAAVEVGREGKCWRELCEVVMHVAKRVSPLSLWVEAAQS